MTYEEFIKEASRCSKEAILKTLTLHYIDIEMALRDIKWENNQIKFNRLMDQSDEINKRIRTLNKKSDFESCIKVSKLFEEDDRIHKKIDALSKQRTKLLDIG